MIKRMKQLESNVSEKSVYPADSDMVSFYDLFDLIIRKLLISFDYSFCMRNVKLPLTCRFDCRHRRADIADVSCHRDDDAAARTARCSDAGMADSPPQR